MHRAMPSLNEEAYGRGTIVRATHYVTFGDSNGDGKKTLAAIERQIAQRKLLAPWRFYTTDDIPEKTQSFIIKELPENVHLLTLDKWTDDGSYLIRLEHIFEKNEDPTLSQEATVDLTVK